MAAATFETESGPLAFMAVASASSLEKGSAVIVASRAALALDSTIDETVETLPFLLLHRIQYALSRTRYSESSTSFGS
ncbi:MAG TPA: hypothetical protein VE135_08390 [Pyrinomonadaceae bacterium]|nr:hypothetical protein [Pyrinomonadaceae bacterium]